MSCGFKAGTLRTACLILLLFAWDAGGVGAEESRPAQAESAPKKVSLQFEGIDVIQVLKILAEQSGFNVIAGRNVTGKATLFIRDVDPWEAFEVVLAANELAYERRGQILSVMSQREYELLYGQPYQDRRILRSVVPRYAKAAELAKALAQVKSNIGRVVADEGTNTLILLDTPAMVAQMEELARQMDQPLETRVFSLNYAPVKNLGPLLQEAVTKGIGKVSVDERTNQVAVTDTPARLAEIERMVRAFDERPLEVFIDAKIVQITLSDKFQMGIDWQYFFSKQLNIKGPNALNLATGGKITLSSLDASKEGEAKIALEALRAFGDTQLLSEPRLTVVNNQEAKILVGSKEPYITTQVSQTGTGTAVTAETVSFIDVGVKLYVTPTIARDGFVQMKIRPEVSSKTGTLTTAQKNEIPIVETSESETVLMVEDGGTVILGGLIKDEDSIDHQRIPVLGDIPLLGLAFRSSKDTVKRTELMIFLTPHIVTGRRGTPPAPPAFAVQPVDGAGYYGWLMEAIQAVAQTQPAGSEEGTVVVAFTLRPDGQLKGRPSVIQSDSRRLADLAVRAVRVVSPFPPFPTALGEEPRQFRIPIRYVQARAGEE